MENISWDDVVSFCNKLSKLEGLQPAYTLSGGSVTYNRGANGYRMPTEAEWEYAARAGTDLLYAGSNTIGDVAWYSGNSSSTTHPVASKGANAWGLYDMSGNVWEWVHDWYDSAYYSSSPGSDPTGPTSGADRVGRGGGWDVTAGSARVANRAWFTPGGRNAYLGVRLVRTIP